MTGSWYDSAVEHIRKATLSLPADMPLAERAKVVDAAYPFGAREHFPYKMWLKARYGYLRHFGYMKPGDPQMRLPLSPLERAQAKSMPLHKHETGC
jgi:hypothetical protein